MSSSAAENKPSSTPEVSEGIVTQQTYPYTSMERCASGIGNCSSNITFKRQIKQEPSLGNHNPNLITSQICHFTFTLDVKSRKPDNSEYAASGELNENVYSALKDNDIFCEMMEKQSAKDILIYGERCIKGYINPGMPLKCLPKNAHLKISFFPVKKNLGGDNLILRKCEDPNMECILFHIVAVGKNKKKIVKMNELHQPATTLCVYALKGETVREALCKDGRFRPDLKDLDWKLVEKHTIIYGRESMVDQVSGKTLEIDIPRNSVRKTTHKKTKQQKENAPSEINPSSQVQPTLNFYESERGKTEDTEQDRTKSLPPQEIGYDIGAIAWRTIQELINYYNDQLQRKYKKMTRGRQWTQARRQYVLQKERASLLEKNLHVLNKNTMHQYPDFNKVVLGMRQFFLAEQIRKKMSALKQFNIYRKDYAKVTKSSTPVALCEQLIHLSRSVGFIKWDNNGNMGNATCFVFNEGFIFTCRHVVTSIVGEGTEKHLWPDIISRCAKVTFTYTNFCPVSEEWLPLEPAVCVSGENLDYAILKLKENENGFPPGLHGKISPQPSSGLVFLIGHPEGEHKQIDGCSLIPVGQRLEKYPEEYRDKLLGLNATINSTFPMFTPRSFQSDICRSDTLSYDTCFSSGSSGSPVFDASGRLVAMHAMGHCCEQGGLVLGLVEYSYSMESILADLKQLDKSLYESLNQEKQDLSLQDYQMETMNS